MAPLLFSLQVSRTTISGGKTTKVARRAIRTSTTVTIPKLLIIGKGGETTSARNPNTVVAPEAMIAVPILALVIWIASIGVAPASFSSK